MMALAACRHLDNALVKPNNNIVVSHAGWLYVRSDLAAPGWAAMETICWVIKRELPTSTKP